MKKLEEKFYQRDTVAVAKDLIGKYLYCNFTGIPIISRITETEAYTGVHDKACHAYGGRLTERTKALYLSGGHAYVFLIYGMYECMNIVTEPEGTPCAVLLRGAEPISPLDEIALRRFQKEYHDLTASQKRNLMNGPGKLTLAMGITRSQNQQSLLGNDFYLFEEKEDPKPQIGVSPRINIDYAEEYVQKPWRFYDKKYVKK